MNVTTLEVRLLPVDSLKPAPYNPRRELSPDSPAYRKLTASLREFGLVEPLVWNETSGYVVGGHARLRILKEIGVTEVSVSIVRLGPEREKALNLVLNNREAQGRFDPAKLVDLLEQLSDLPELDLTGFSAKDLAALRMEPVAGLEPQETETGGVEITIATDKPTYERFAGRLDAIAGEFDLTCHVRTL
jgi:ParB-like chromosome segregation protein Spo0J